ncbi:MAG TPA: DUF3016 domain-containing protein [Burkholderiaceae bacterium]|nr:DUF3016 domain-containing protein [Burkholderiaceae bacterium]
MRLTVLFVIAQGLASAAIAGGTVEVSFIKPQTYADAGQWQRDVAATQARITQHLQSLGESYLADGQALRVEVIDVDRAGWQRHVHRRVDDIRVLRNGADWPRIKLRYALVANGQLTKSGEETLADLDYMGRFSLYNADDPMRYEKRMLEDWFKTRFATTAQ